MKTRYSWKWTLKSFFIATLLASIAVTVLAVPVTHASSLKSTTSSNNAVSQNKNNALDDCNEFLYLGGNWPAQFHLGGCTVNTMQQNSWTVDIIKTVVSDGLTECAGACTITLDVLAVLIHHEIDHLVDESNSCGGQGVNIDVYGIVFRTFPVCSNTTTIANIPVLQSTYNNYSVRRQDGQTFNEMVNIDSQDEQGNLEAQWATDGVTYDCQGDVTSNSDVYLNCVSDNAFDFSGHVYPDGHIEGTSVGTQSGNIYDEYMS